MSDIYWQPSILCNLCLNLQFGKKNWKFFQCCGNQDAWLTRFLLSNSFLKRRFKLLVPPSENNPNLHGNALYLWSWLSESDAKQVAWYKGNFMLYLLSYPLFYPFFFFFSSPPLGSYSSKEQRQNNKFSVWGGTPMLVMWSVCLRSQLPLQTP